MSFSSCWMCSDMSPRCAIAVMVTARQHAATNANMSFLFIAVSPCWKHSCDRPRMTPAGNSYGPRRVSFGELAWSPARDSLRELHGTSEALRAAAGPVNIAHTQRTCKDGVPQNPHSRTRAPRSCSVKLLNLNGRDGQI